MSATYEPGSVAVATVRGVPNVRVMRGDGIFGNKWYTNRPVSGSLTSFTDFEVTDIRPLVVLDPKGHPEGGDGFVAGHFRAYAAELRKTWRGPQSVAARELEFIADQIEAQTTPPKPAEPMGWLAAVEEPGADRRWYRDGDPCSDHPWRQVRHDGVHARDQWAALPANVRVLSEGVTS